MGESIQFPKPESEIRFGWGLSYNYIGQMHHNLNKYDVIVSLEIPDFRIIPYYKPFNRDPKYCHKWNTGIKTKLLFETCQKIWPAYIGTIAKLDDSQERIQHIMEKEIPCITFICSSTQDSEACDPSSNLSGTSMFCNGGGFLSVKDAFSDCSHLQGVWIMCNNSKVRIATVKHSSDFRFLPI